MFSGIKTNKSTVTTLIDNIASGNLRAEHGLSLWIEYEDKKILFDTGQSDLLLRNAKILGVDLADTDAIVISHGHYDHTGGLHAVLDIARKATLYIHPNALEPKFSRKGKDIRMIGMPDTTKEIIRTLSGKKKVVWAEKPAEVFPGLFVTSRIPRNSDLENTDNTFFSDRSCQKPDLLQDDQAMFFEISKGLIVLLGCAHAGVVNTLDYVAKLSGQKYIYCIIGGMHLLSASMERIKYTIEALKQYKVQKIGIAHCTGHKAVEKLKEVFANRCFICSAGSRINLQE